MAGVFSTGLVRDRIDTTVYNIERYKQGDSDSSVGARLDMYEFSWGLFLQAPLFGHGLGAFKEKAIEAREGGLLDDKSRVIGIVNTPHNEFFLAAVERGLVGLFVLLLLFAVPGYIFSRAAFSYDYVVAYYGVSGIGLLVVFFVAGQTGTLFHHNVFTHFYILMMFLFVSQIRARVSVVLV